MKLQTFFDKFELFADAPDAVGKMRELVLRLAFSGELIGKGATDDGVPDGWENRTIESISASISSGFACSRSHQVANGHVHLRTHNISTLGTLNFDLLVRIDPKMIDPQKASIRVGDILFNNTNSQELVGKTALVDRDYDYGFSNHITRIRLKDSIFPGFVVYYFTLLRNSGYFARLCTRWINQAAVNTDTLKEQTVPLPPLAEQKRIVAKIDELMALCDQLEVQQQERKTRHIQLARASLARFADAPTPANLNFLFHNSYSISPADLRKSILTLAVQGKLVPQDPNDESADQLLSTISKQRAKLFESDSLRRTKPGREFNASDAPYEIPETWSWTLLGEITDVGTGSTPSRTDSSFWVGGTIPWITSGSTSHSLIVVGDEFVTPAAVKVHRLRVYPPGTLLVALYGQGKTRGQVASLEIPATVNQACAAICPLSGIPSMQGYLKLLLEKQYDEMRALSAGGAQPNLNVQKIKELFVALPPLAEQHRIVAKVNQLMTLVDQLELQLTASLSTAEKLTAAIVAELSLARQVA